MKKKLIITLILIKFILFLPTKSLAEGIFLLSETRTITNKTVRICGEKIFSDRAKDEDVPLFQIFPGRKIIDISPVNDKDTLFELFTSTFIEKSIQDDGIYYSLVDSSGRIKDLRFFYTGPNWEVIHVFPYKEPTTYLQQYAVFQKRETENYSLGRVLLFNLEDDDFLRVPIGEIPIPFAPDTVCPHSEKGMWVAVKSEIFGAPQFCIIDACLKMSRPFLLDVIQEECIVSEILSLQDTFLLVLTHSRNGDSQDGKSRVFVLDTKKGVILTEPMPLLGEGDAKEKNIYPTPDGFWIKTTSFPEGFGYLTFANWDPVGGWEKKLEYSFSGIEYLWEIAVHPSKKIVAVAYNNRLEIVGEPFYTSQIEKFEEPITFLNWYSDAVLIVSTGGRLFQTNIDDKKTKEWFHAHKGVVSKIFPLPSKQMKPPSGGPLNEIIVDEIQFHSERAGKDVQGVWLGGQHPSILDWEISFMSNPVDWLLWYQNHYFKDTYLYLGLIPCSWGDYIPSVWLRVKPIIHQEQVDSSFSIPATRYVRVQVVKSKISPQRILFVWAQSLPDSFRSEKDPREVKSLVDMLSGMPYYFSCDEVSEPVNNDALLDCGVVVIEAKAIAGGMVSIKDLLDYVFQGGKLLILGDYWPGGNAELFNYWFAPLGILYDPGQRFDGNLPIDMENFWDWREKQINIVGGGTLRSASNATSPLIIVDKAPVSNARQVACLSRDYGYGKIVVLSSRTPLTSEKLPDNKNKAFALGLFQKLAFSEVIFTDTDGDGLSDALEDRNQNSITDGGETNPLTKDSDGDGISDGDEDLNRNGIWDENETDPTCEDSDGDGIWDGADISPIPAFGKQVIMRIDPAEAFAEGGTIVFIHGRNFTNDTQFVFNNRLSPFSRILSPEFALVVVPEFHQDEGGKVFVYATQGKNKIKTEPAKPFVYKPRNKIEVKISDVSYIADTGIIVDNVIRIQIVPSPKASNLKRIYFLLRLKKDGLPEIKTEDNRWDIKLTHIQEEWYLIIAEWKKTGSAFGTLTFDIISTSEDAYSPEIVKVWAETAYYGRLAIEVRNAEE